MHVELYTSAFCAPCHAMRVRMRRAEELVPGLVIEEIDALGSDPRPAAENILSTPTLIVRGTDGVETGRLSGAAPLPHILAVLATALPEERTLTS